MGIHCTMFKKLNSSWCRWMQYDYKKTVSLRSMKDQGLQHQTLFTRYWVPRFYVACVQNWLVFQPGIFLCGLDSAYSFSAFPISLLILFFRHPTFKTMFSNIFNSFFKDSSGERTYKAPFMYKSFLTETILQYRISQQSWIHIYKQRSEKLHTGLLESNPHVKISDIPTPFHF